MESITHCCLCERNISNNNWKRHKNSCCGKKIKKIRGIDFDPNHGYKTGERKAWNQGLTKHTDARIERSGTMLSEQYKLSILKPSGCCSSLYLGSEQHRKSSSKGGGYRENSGRSKKFKVHDSFGKETVLQSSFELKCSIILNEMGIDWIRPKALKYDGRRYFADFYLPKFNVWLDPKNSYKEKLDREKIQKVIDQNDIKLYVLLEHQITKEFIASIINY